MSKSSRAINFSVLPIERVCGGDCSPLIAHSSPLFFLRRQRQSEYRDHSRARDVDLALPRSGQVQRLAVFAAIHFGIRAPSLLNVTTFAFHHVGLVGQEL